MADVVERLRAVTEDDAYASPWTFGETCREAAAEIKTLRAERSALVAVNDRLVRSAESLRARLSQAGAGGGVDEKALQRALEMHRGLAPAPALAKVIETYAAALAPSPGEPIGWVVGSHFYKEDPGALSGKIVVYTTPPATPVQPTASVEGVHHALWLAEGRLELLLREFPDESQTSDHPVATKYVLSKVKEALASLTPAPTDGDGR